MGYFNFENNVTPANDTNLNAMQQGLMELVFPVGSTYITQSNTNPNTILKFGTWERLKGKVCVGLDENDTDFNTIGKEGGEKEHTLTVNEIPNHDHNLAIDGGSGAGQMDRVALNGYGESRWYSHVRGTGGGQAHNNLQPYRVVGYMWIRTA